MIHPTAYIAPDATIGKGVSIGMYSYIPDTVTLEDNVFVGPGVFFQSGNHPPKIPDIGNKTVVRKSVSIGAGCVIWTGVVIGEGAIICPGTVVTRDMAAGEVFYGNPARKKREDGKRETLQTIIKKRTRKNETKAEDRPGTPE